MPLTAIFSQIYKYETDVEDFIVFYAHISNGHINENIGHKWNAVNVPKCQDEGHSKVFFSYRKVWINVS